MLPVELSEVFRVSVTCRQMKDPVLRTVYQRPIGFTKMRYGFGKRIEHRLQVERRAADDLEDLGGRGLLLQGLGEFPAARLNFVEQPHVLDGDHCLVGKRRHKLDLLGRKWLRCVSAYGNNADASALPKQWDPEQRAVATDRLGSVSVFRIGERIRNVHHPGLECDSSRDRVSARRNGMLL